MTKSAPHLTLASLLLVASLVSTRRVTGQETPPSPNAQQPQVAVDSLPFREGQWGAEFAINDGTFGLGVLRFRSARRAWLLDASIGASWSHTEGGFSGEETGRSVFVRLRAGPRRYRPIASGAAAYLGTGLTGAYAWSVDGISRRQLWDAGVYGELGAVYFVTRRLSLGARVEAAASYAVSRQTASNPSFDYRDSRFSVGLTPVRIVGALYF